MSAQSKSGDGAEGATPTAFDCPEKVGIAAGVDDAHPAVGSDDFGLDQSRRRRAKAFRKRPETSALNETGDADIRTAAALHITAASHRYYVVEVHPDRTRFGADGGYRSDATSHPGVQASSHPDT
jgi:hypothetical protein